MHNEKLAIVTSQHITHDLISGGPVTKVLDFGQHAYADTFISKDQLHLSEPVFPLQVYLGEETGSLQLGYVSHAEDRYNLYSYSYTSSNSKTARDHWDEYASTIKRFGDAGLVVEIGSNDGYLISQFKSEHTTAVGIDSSEEMCSIAKARGVDTVNALFDSSIAESLKSQYGLAKIIMANNVFNHANDPVAFAKAIRELLDPTSGVFVFEVPYWLSMIESDRFTDMVYHEHPTYFTVKMAWNVLQKAGLKIVDYDVVDYHGGSLRVIAQVDTDGVMPVKVEDAIARETQLGLFSTGFYETLQQRFKILKIEWLDKFYKLLNDDPHAVVIGVGAAAKANTWLRWHGLDNSVIKFITDSSEHKQGKYTPLSRIPIHGDEIFANYERPYALVLSWNIGEGLKKAILNINPNTRFISQ